MKKAIILLSAVAATTAIGVQARDAAAQAPPGAVSIERVSASGSGCPTGTVDAEISPDKQALTLTFEEFHAEAGPGIDPRQSSKFCGARVLLRYPAGWTYSILNVQYDGRVNLAPRTIGQQTSTYWFQGQSGRPYAQTTVYGPAFGPYSRIDEVNTLVWAPCGTRRTLYIDSDVSVSNSANPEANAFMNLKFQTISLEATYRLVWRRC